MRCLELNRPIFVGLLTVLLQTAVVRADELAPAASDKQIPTEATQTDQSTTGDKTTLDEPAAEPLERIKGLQRQFDEQSETLAEELEAALAKLAELAEKKNGLAERFLTDLMAIVEAAPSDPAAVDAIGAILEHQLDRVSAQQASVIFQTLVQHHLASERMESICRLAADLELNQPIRDFLQQVVEKNPHPKVQVWALYVLAVDAYTSANEAEDRDQYEQAEKLFEQAVKAIPADHTEGTPVDAAQQYLFELQHLMVGQVAPDFESEDLNGKHVRLRSQRGKVVLLVFWATWCNYCEELLPQQDALATEYHDRPLSLVSVSADDEAVTVNDYLAEHPLLWTHWWNGASGGVLETWNVQAFPTIYLIDADGKIRYRNLQGEQLNEAIKLLVEEAEQLGDTNSQTKP